MASSCPRAPTSATSSRLSPMRRIRRAPSVTMADMSTLEVEADVAESSLAKVARRSAGGDRARRAARRALPRPHQPHRCRRSIARKATVMTKVKFDAIDPRILPEMSAKVSFLSQDVTAANSRSRCVAVSDRAPSSSATAAPWSFVMQRRRGDRGARHAGDEGRRPDGHHRRREERRQGVPSRPRTWSARW